LKVLLCDDNIEAASSLRQQLKTVGIGLDIAHTAGDALHSAATTQYHAILVDLKLPDADGISLILQVRQLPGHGQTPIIVVSADPSPGRQDQRSSKLNVLDWLHKPVDFGHLMRILTKPAAPDAGRRPMILFVDGDNAAPDALKVMADVVSINSIDEAPRAVKDQNFDLVVINIARPTKFGPDLLHDLHNRSGHAVPVVVSAAEGDGLADDLRVPGTNESIAGLVATVREHLTGGARPAREIV
jgi:DNA-binding response OmpR family regulator